MDTAEQAVFLFGPAELGVTGNFLLTQPVHVSQGSILTMYFNIAGTVTTGPLALTAPALTIID